MSRDRGRPQATTREAIVEEAFAAFREHGFVETTMAEIARRVGVSRATLFRNFPNKAAILWYSLAETTADFEANLAAQPDGSDLADGAFAAYQEVWDHRSPHANEIGKNMVRTIEISPPEMTGKWRTYEAWANLVHAYVLERTGLPASDTSARAAAMAIWAAIWSAASAFALADTGTLRAQLDAARSALEVRLPARVK